MDTWVKRGASQATDYQFRWEWKPQDRCGKRVVRVNWEGVEDAAVCEAPLSRAALVFLWKFRDIKPEWLMFNTFPKMQQKAEASGS